MKRGFSLIELLAVILVLGIIVLIAVPKVIDIIDGSREGSFKASVQIIKKEAERQCNTDKVNQRESISRYVIKNAKINPELFVKAKIPEFGEIIVSETCDVILNAYTDRLCNITEEDEVIMGRVKDDKCVVNGVEHNLPNVE